MTEKQTIQKFIDDAERDLIINYNRTVKASGNWAKELVGSYKEIGSGFRITFLGSSYTQQLVNGRPPNHNKKNIKAFIGWAGSTFLKDWVEQKGLKISPYAIAGKIAKEGIKVPNRFNSGTLLSDVFTDNRIEKLLKDLSGAIISEVRTDLIKN